MLEHGIFHYRWESYNKTFNNGFLEMYQMQEFVDVTLAAGGHLVGAHKNILALASPYLREMLQSAPCQHPVIFLGPLKREVLVFLLEYMYTGEVKIPSHVLPSFIEASRMLHIEGIKDLQMHQNLPNSIISTENNKESNNYGSSEYTNAIVVDESQMLMQKLSNQETQPHEEMLVLNNNDLSQNEISEKTVGEVGSTCFAASIQIDNENHKVNIQPITYENVDNIVKNVNNYLIMDGNKAHGENFELTQRETTQTKSDTNNDKSQDEERTDNIDTPDIGAQMPENNVFEVDVCTGSGLLTIRNLPNISENNGSNVPDLNKITGKIETALYIKSIRGSLQMILNRFIYNLHHTSYKNSKRRWRCIDYRRRHCPAYVDTIGEIIESRKGMHSHPFHDSKILKLGKKQDIYTSIARATDMLVKKKKNEDNTKVE